MPIASTPARRDNGFAIVLLAVAGLAASSETRAQTPPVDAGPTTCTALPAVRPRGLTLVASRSVLPHGASVRHEVAEIVERPASCQHSAPLCRVAPAAVLDRLFQQALAARPDRYRTTPAHRSPHFGSRYVTIRWDGGRCEVGESSQQALDERDRTAFGTLYDGIVTAFLALPATRLRP